MLERRNLVNGTSQFYVPDEVVRMKSNSMRHFRSATNQTLTQRTYWRDDRDRIYAWAKGTDASLNPMENGRGDHYWYDNEGQLTGASYQAADPSGSASSPQRVDSFSYDELGNRVRWNNVASRGPMYFERRDNGLNQYQSWQNNIPAPDPAHWGSGIFYDDNFPYPGWVPPGNGVTMGDGVITASYNALNQPRAISIPAPGSNFMWFGFDPLGRCVKRWIGPYTAPNDPPANTNPAAYLYYEGWNLLQEGPASGGWIWNGSAFVMGAGGGMAKCYLHGARVDEIVMSAVMPSGALTFHHYDARGHAIVLSDQSGNVVEQYDYDAFGKPYFYTGSGTSLPNGSNYGNRFLFTGREWLSEVKLYDFRNRLYQPELGRFLQPDPKEFEAGDYNLYRYCHNDPVNRSDPTGLREPIASDFIWETAHHFDSANTGQGTLSQLMARLFGGAGEDVRMGKGGNVPSKQSETKIDNGLKRFDISGAITDLDGAREKYRKMFPDYPDPDSTVGALKRARDSSRIQAGLPGNFRHGNPMTTINGVVLIDPRARLDRPHTAAFLSHEGQHLVDTDFSSRFGRERRAFDVQYGFGSVLGLNERRKTDEAIHSDYGF